MSAVTRLLEGVSHLVRAERAGLRTRLLTLGEAISSTAVPDVGISFSSRSLDGAGDGLGVFLAETNGEGCRIVHHFVFVASFIEDSRSLGGAVRGEGGNARELNTGSLTSSGSSSSSSTASTLAHVQSSTCLRIGVVRVGRATPDFRRRIPRSVPGVFGLPLIASSIWQVSAFSESKQASGARNSVLIQSEQPTLGRPL